MINAFFLVAIIIICLTAWRGYRRGLFGIVYGIVSWVLISIFVLIASPAICNFLMETPSVYNGLYDGVYPYVDGLVPANEGADYNLNDSDKALLEQYIENFIGSDELPEQYRYLLDAADSAADTGLGSVADGISQIRNSMVEKTAKTLTGYMLRALSVILSYIIAKVITLLLRAIIYGFLGKGSVGLLMKYLGAAFGFGEGILYIWVAMLVISLTRLTSTGAELYGQIVANPLMKIMYDNNVLIRLFGGA